MRTYDLIVNLLYLIEENINKHFYIKDLASQLYISPAHLQRIFKFAFGIPLASYIRSRRLSSSLEFLYKSKLTILNIAMEFDFEFEQSYIRAFKHEFGTTPAKARKNREILKVTSPLYLFPSNILSNDVLFGPEIVMIPEFQNVYYGLTRVIENTDFSHYLTAVQVNDLNNIPFGFETDTFETSLGIRFRYIGKHHYYDINADIAKGMYNVIASFGHDENSKYGLHDNKLYFERIDSSAYDGTFCMMEWFSPVYEKK